MNENDNNIQYKILVVEDNKIINNLIQKTLNGIGYETHGAFYGKDAKNLINKNKNINEYLILIDYLLPDMYGGDLVDKLIKEFGKINFIILTGYGDEKVAVEMMKKGALDYVVKEENFIDLLPSIISRAIKEINQEKKIEDVELKLKSYNELLENITANLPNYIYWKDINLKYLGCNENFTKLIGFNKPQEIINKNDHDLNLSISEIESFKKFDNEVIKNQKSIIEMEEINIKTSGNKISLLTNRIPITNSDGKISGVIFIGTDVTECKFTENKLNEQYNFIQTLIETIPNPIYYKDKNGRYLGCNKSFEELFNIKKTNIINKTVFDITPKDLAEKHKEMDSILLKNPGTQVYKWKLKDKDNNLREAIYNKATFNDSKGNVIGLIGLITDITEIIKKEEALKEGENKYKLLVESSPNIIYIFSSKRGIIYWSPRVESILGFNNDDLKKNPFIWYNSIHPDDIKKVDKIINDKSENKDQIIDIEYRIKDKKGNLRWLHDCIISKKIVDKEIITEGNAIDITERKKSDERQSLIIKILQLLNKKEERINIIQEILSLIKEFTGIEAIGIRLKEGDDFPYFETNGFTKQLIEKENFLCTRNKNGKLVFDEQGKPALEGMCGTVLLSKTNKNYPFFTNGGSYWTNSTTEMFLSTTELERKIHMRNKCHQEGYESLALIPLKSGKNIIGLLQLNDKRKNIFTLDLIEFFEKIGDSIGIALERKKSEEKLIKLNEELENRVKQRTQQLEETNAELESFAYSVSHDLRAPLRHIYGFSELLIKEAKNQLKEKEDRYLNNIIYSVKNMEKLINDILEFSRMGRSKLNYSILDFRLLVEESKKISIEDIKNREIIWNIKKLPKIKCDISMMKQVLINLISNALKYTRKRKKAVIEIGTMNNNKNEITFYIKDNGVGFNMEYSEKLFGVFQRLHNDREFEGTGIGLAIIKRIITRHGGKVWASGKINKGAIFYFTLPNK